MSLRIVQYPDLSGPLYHFNRECVLRFSEKEWLYLLETPEGLKPIDGTTSTLKIVDKSEALLGWACKTDFARLMSLLEGHRRNDGFIEALYSDVEKIVAEAKKAHREHLEDAGRVGKSAHSFVESLARAILGDNDTRLLEILATGLPEDDRACMCAVSAVVFFSEHKVKFIATEQRVFSREWMVAGTLDGDILISSCGNQRCACSKFGTFVDKRVILDLKTSNSIHPVFMAQTAFYQKAKTEEFPDCQYDGRLILRLGKEDPEDFEPAFLFGDDLFQKHLTFFKRALDLKHSVEETEAEMRTARDEQRAEKKLARAAEKAERIKLRCDKADSYKGTRLSKCLPDGSQCEACHAKYVEVQGPKCGAADDKHRHFAASRLVAGVAVDDYPPVTVA